MDRWNRLDDRTPDRRARSGLGYPGQRPEEAMVEAHDRRMVLERPARGRRRRWIGVLRALGWAGVVVVLLRLASDSRTIDCERAVRSASAGRAAGVCQREYAETGSPDARGGGAPRPAGPGEHRS